MAMHDGFLDWLTRWLKCDHEWFIPDSERWGPAGYKMCARCGTRKTLHDDERDTLPRRLDD